MPLFGAKKKDPQPPKLAARLRLSSLALISLTTLLKLLLRGQTSPKQVPTLGPLLLPEPQLPSIAQEMDKLSIRPNLGEKRVLTIVETNSDDDSDEGSDLYDDTDEENDGEQSPATNGTAATTTLTKEATPHPQSKPHIAHDHVHSFNGGDDSDDSDSDSDYEDHHHAIKSRGKVISGLHFSSFLSTFMEYCGLGSSNNPSNSPTLALQSTIVDAAIAELKHTFSLLTTVKIHQLSATLHREDPRLQEALIAEPQVELIEDLKLRLKNIFRQTQDHQASKLALEGKSLFDRYGTVRDVIGRGLYGTIKIVVRDDETSNRTAFAVKELHRRRMNSDGSGKIAETGEKFVERVLSEFIISLTLNLKHIVKTVDLMVTLPGLCWMKQAGKMASIDPNSLCIGDRSELKLSQVMRCTSGGDLFTYMTTKKDLNGQAIETVSLEEIDCFIKQIARGVWYMHQHGVAHCDLKLENILIQYQDGKLLLKISDFGKLSVFRTKWDGPADEEKIPYLTGPIGSEPYIAPEEYEGEYAPTRKDFWLFGVIVLLLFNIRRHYYLRSGSIDTPGGYLWHLTEPKQHVLRKGNKEKRWKDKGFESYIRERMVADYNRRTKEWLIVKKGTYLPIEDLFESEDALDEDELDFCELRKLFIYKLLDPNPATRMNIDDFVKGDWMRGVEACF